VSTTEAQTPNRNSLYSEAQRILRERHRDEFEQIVTEEYRKVGLTYRPRLTDEQKAERARQAEQEKAEKALQRLVEQYPVLRDRVSVLTAQEGASSVRLDGETFAV
jgi:hypothetical protein